MRLAKEVMWQLGLGRTDQASIVTEVVVGGAVVEVAETDQQVF